MRLDRKDLALWGVTFGLVLLAAILLHGAAYRLAAPGFRFSGFFYNSYDAFTCRVWAAAYARDGFLVDNPYSVEPQPPVYFNLLWFSVGQLMRLTGLPFIFFYYLLGALAGGLLYLTILALMRQLISRRGMAWCAYLLAGFGGGFGWIVALLSPDFFEWSCKPADIFNAEGYPFLAALALPQTACILLLIALTFLFACEATVGEGKRMWAAGVAVLPLGFIDPNQLVTIAGVLAAWYLLLGLKYGRPWFGRWRRLLLPAAGMVPGLVYGLGVLRTSPNFSFWRMQNGLCASDWQGLVIGFGPFFLLAFLSFRGFLPLGAFTDRYLFVAAWALVQFGLIFFFPQFAFRGQLVPGYILPLAILATWGFFGSVLPSLGFGGEASSPAADIHGSTTAGGSEDSREDSRQLIWAVILVLLTMPTHLMIVANQTSKITRKSMWFRYPHNNALLLREKEIEAMEFLGREARGRPVVLPSDSGSGWILPAFADVRSCIGNVYLSPDYSKASEGFEAYWNRETSHRRRREFLDTARVDYTLWNRHEAPVDGFVPDTAPYLGKIFDNGDVRIFKVAHGASLPPPGGLP